VLGWSGRARVRLDELPAEIGSSETFTEIVVTELHETGLACAVGRAWRSISRGASRTLLRPCRDGGPRCHGEGTAQKRSRWLPRRFTGNHCGWLPICRWQGFPSAHVELYLARGAERPAIQVSCAGTLVADDVGELTRSISTAALIGCEISGLIRLPGSRFSPGSRTWWSRIAQPRRSLAR